MSEDTSDFNAESQGKRSVPDPLGLIGWTIGEKYRVLSYVGGGGFAEVYRAVNVNLTDQQLVIKIFKKIRSQKKFEREARIVSKLDHPNICSIIDYLPRDGAMVVPFINGSNCEQLISSSGRFSHELWTKVAAALLDALAYAHSHRIAHRDIKPSNLMISQSGRVYVIDFGIAKEIGQTTTRTGYGALTPQFAAPERQDGRTDYNPFLSDVYEVGATLFYLYTGEHPYRNPERPNINDWGGRSASKLTRPIRKLLRRATNPDPRNRFDSIEEMKSEFRRTTGSEPMRRSSAIFGSVLLLVIVVFAVLWLSPFYRQQNVQSLGDGELSGPSEAEIAELSVSGTEVDQQDVALVRSRSAPDSVESLSKYGGARSTRPSVPNSTKQRPDSNRVSPYSDHAQIDSVPIGATNHMVSELNSVADQLLTETLTYKGFKVRFLTIPGGAATIYMDSLSTPVDSTIVLPEGRHPVRLMHRAYPILDADVEVFQDTLIILDLEALSEKSLPVELDVWAKPLLEGVSLSVSLNGYANTRTFMEVPARGVKLLSGCWLGRFEISDVTMSGSTALRVDSFSVKLQNGNLVQMEKGNEAILNLDSATLQGETVANVYLYWTRVQEP